MNTPTTQLDGFKIIIASVTLFILLLINPAAHAQNFLTQEGFPMEIRLKTDRETIMLNEPAYIYLEIANHSPHKLCVSEGGDYRNRLGRPESFTVKVTKEDGTSVPQPEIGLSMGGLSGCSPIPANGNHVTKLLLPHWATFESTGIYDINVSKALHVKNYQTKTSNTFEASANLRIEIVPVEQVKLSSLIDSLGNLILDAKSSESARALSQLSYIKNQQTFERLSSALAKYVNAAPNSSEESICRQLISLLSKYDDDATIEIFSKAMSSSNDQVRSGIADAFSTSTNLQAAKPLTKMYNDSYWFVRLKVAQGLGQRPLDDSISILKTLLADENEDVKKSAQSSLVKLKRP